MTSMQVVGLAETKAEALADVFAEEVMAWRSQLHWDYGPALKVIERFIRARTLPGFALCRDNACLGYGYYVVDRGVGFIGSLYVAEKKSSSKAYKMLLKAILDAMGGKVERIESQVFPFNIELEPIFKQKAFEARPRSFLTIDPTQTRQAGPRCSVKIRVWEPRYLIPAAEAIFDSYQRSSDFELCRDYQSREGCIRFLRNLIENPACGSFDAENTRVALDEDGRLCGVLLTSRIADDTGMVPQLSIRQDHQGQGIGSLLLTEYLNSATTSGLSRVSLSVSRENRRAFELYRRLGFEVVREFHAFIWDREDRC